ncbi:MAG: DUF5119 domain-containing protein, partial [Muribaculaceae bacterium]|nr:DUF5119 domain-containing protein [Muribaculaceae bacterium]
MKKSGYHIIQLLCIIMLLMLASCRDELCYNHFPAASFAFEWEQEWERDYGMNHNGKWDATHYGYDYHSLRPGSPSWVNLVRYGYSGSSTEKYLSKDGGHIVLEENDYKSFLIYNGDTEYIVLSDMASVTEARASATARSRSSISYIEEIYPDTRSTNPPDILYSAYIDSIPYVEFHETKHFPVKMQPLVYTYLVRYEFEYGLKHVALARGALGGMDASVYLRTGTTSDNPTIILYDCDMKDYGFEAQVRSFGVPGFPDEYYGRSGEEQKDRKYTLNLELKIKNGSTLEFNYDITDQ